MGKLIDLNGLGHFKDKENEMIAADYSATKTYAVGDYVYYNGVLKRCITAITTAEAYTAAHWTNAVLADDVTELKTAIASETPITFTLATGFINTSSIGVNWTENLGSSTSYRYINGGIDLSSYRTFNAYVRLTMNSVDENSARFGFSDSNNIITWVTTNTLAKNSYYHNLGNNKYELILPIIGNKLFYSNKNAIMNSLTVDIIQKAENNNSLINSTQIIYYISPSGIDKNDGKTPETGLRTIQEAIARGATVINMVKGTFPASQIYDETQTKGKTFIINGNGSVIDGGNGNLFKIEDANVEINDLTISNTTSATGRGFWLTNCQGKMRNCKVINNNYQAFAFNGCDMVLENCEVDGATVDGFNGHTYTDANSNVRHSNLTLINCKANNCGDDGASVHENGSLTIIGGEYSNCTNGGITPHKNCYCNVQNAILQGNGKGIEASVPQDYTTETPQKVYAFNCLIINNTIGIDLAYYDAISVGTKFVNNTTKDNVGTGATLTEY